MSKDLNLYLPETEVHWNAVKSYIERVPEEGYPRAPESAREAFKDMKFGVRIHWGLYSKWGLQEESWPLLKMSPADKHKYQELYQDFNPDGFDAGEWMRFFSEAGFKCFAFTAKHHDGFSLFDTATKVKQRVNWAGSNGPQIEECDSSYSVMDSPYKKDIVGELCDAARAYGIKVDLYFSHPDWYDVDFRPYCFHPVTVPDYEKLLTKRELSEYPHRFEKQYPIEGHTITKEEKERMVTRHKQQLTELVTKYGNIDMLCLDMWLGVDVWPHLKETIKELRKIAPNVMLRCRGIGNYGDYYTPEGFVPGSKENTDMPWMVIYPLANTFSYDPDGERYKGSEWVIENLIDAVAKGGNFMVGIGPDGNGRWHPKAVEQLLDTGKWLAVNGEAIYATRPRPGTLYKEGDEIYYTCSKDGTFVYAISMKWPGRSLYLTTVQPKAGTTIRMLGVDEDLKWQSLPDGKLVIDIPEKMQNEQNRPCKMAYAFKIEAF